MNFHAGKSDLFHPRFLETRFFSWSFTRRDKISAAILQAVPAGNLLDGHLKKKLR